MGTPKGHLSRFCEGCPRIFVGELPLGYLGKMENFGAYGVHTYVPLGYLKNFLFFLLLPPSQNNCQDTRITKFNKSGTTLVFYHTKRIFSYYILWFLLKKKVDNHFETTQNEIWTIFLRRREYFTAQCALQYCQCYTKWCNNKNNNVRITTLSII